ncbi:MAG: ATP-binding protein [Methylovulum sp.]|nr:ATP-binding protein [Methylovulum sp.]
MCTSVIQVDVIIPTQTKYLSLIGSIGERIARELDNYSGDKEALAYHLNLVLTEATANAIKHATLTTLENTVRILIHIEDNELNIKVYDHGQGFDLESVPLPDFDQPKESGMGLFFIKTLMDSVTYTRLHDCNILEIIKYL